MLALKEKGLNIILIIALIWLSGCENENPVNNGNKITGTVNDVRGFPVSGLNVSIGNHQPFYLTQSDGKFNFDNSEYPYDIKIGYSHLYKGLSTKNIKLTSDFFAYRNQKTIYIKTPSSLKKNETAAIKFLSDKTHYSLPIFVYQSGSSSLLYIEYPLINYSIDGKLVYLSFSTGKNGTITSYDHYGEKKIMIANSEDDTITFSDNEINFDPPECDVTLNVTNQNLNYSYTSFSLNFRDFKYNPILPIRDFVNKNFSNVIFFKEPLINTSVNVKINTVQYLHDTTSFIFPGENLKSNYFDVCTGGSINVPSLNLLKLPVNNETGINRTTDFTFGNDEQSGIYEFNIFVDLGKNEIIVAKVYTSERRINLGELIDYEFNIRPFTSYFWNVIKYTGYKTIDEFTDKPPFEKTDDKEIIKSPLKRFVTGSFK